MDTYDIMMCAWTVYTIPTLKSSMTIPGLTVVTDNAKYRMICGDAD